MNTKWKSLIHRMRTDQRGIVAIMVGFGLFAIAGMIGLVAQEAILYRTQSALQSSANLAALAGAQDINCCSSAPGTAKTTATSYSAVTGDSNAISGQTVTMATGYPQLKCLTSTGVSCTGPDSANAIVVKEGDRAADLRQGIWDEFDDDHGDCDRGRQGRPWDST